MKQVFTNRVGSPHSIFVYVEGVQYKSIAEAARKTGRSRYAITKLNRSYKIDGGAFVEIVFNDDPRHPAQVKS